MHDENLRSEDAFERLRAGGFAFVDAGCGDGASLAHCESAFRLGPGLGLDRSRAKVERARCRGHAAVVADVLETPLPARSVAFASMMDFLEHLPDEATAGRVVERLAGVARDFLFIRHPSFEHVDYLAAHGLKFGWTDWTGHPNPMRLDAFRELFARLGLERYVVVPGKRVLDSGHHALVPLGAPRDTVCYDRGVHGDKPAVRFDRVVPLRYDLIVHLDPGAGRLSRARIVARGAGGVLAALRRGGTGALLGR